MWFLCLAHNEAAQYLQYIEEKLELARSHAPKPQLHFVGAT